jgi:hypothetical protein
VLLTNLLANSSLLVFTALCLLGCHQVHAFNCLRCVFNDAALALDTSGFHAAGVAAAIRGMAADAWEVRDAVAVIITYLTTCYRRVHCNRIDCVSLLTSCVWLLPSARGGFVPPVASCVHDDVYACRGLWQALHILGHVY